jgi:hypothetical protein
MQRTLVWMTHSFRQDSRLTTTLNGDCTFVYYSPWHFAGERERSIYQSCSQANLDAFYWSINNFSDLVKEKTGAPLYVFRVQDPVAHINQLCSDHGFTNVVIDQPMFAMWHTINQFNINVPVISVDSDLIDNACFKMTAKSRWTTHIEKVLSFKDHTWSNAITGFKLPKYKGKGYPKVGKPDLLDTAKVNKRILDVMFDYGQTRNHHEGQTRMSVSLHNGALDPANTFYAIARGFLREGFDIKVLTGPAAAILRQQAFREISIIQARRNSLTLENTPLEWAKKLMHIDAFNNMVDSRPNIKSKLSLDAILDANTGDKDLDFLLRKLIQDRIMPNRARMYYASKMFYESLSGVQALELTIATFDLIGLDGQSPNNYTQCIGALGLSYGKVLKMNRDRAWELLGY